MCQTVEIDRLANLVHEKEAECLKLANSLKKTIKNSENKEKLQHILEIKSKEFQIKTGEYDKKLEATNDIVRPNYMYIIIYMLYSE